MLIKVHMYVNVTLIPCLSSRNCIYKCARRD